MEVCKLDILNKLIDSFEMASIYALISLALTLGANINGMINFIMGQLFVISIYVIAFFCDLKVPIMISLLVAIAVCVIINLLIKKYVYDLVKRHSQMMSLIVSIGVSFVIQDIFVFVFRANPKKLFYTVNGTYKSGIIEINYTDLICLLVFLFIMLAGYLFVKYTRLGKIIRAVSEDSESTALMGIDNDKIICFVYGICAGLVAIAGSFFCITFSLADPFSGNMIILRSLIGAIIGGLGIVSGSLSKSVIGALCGGFAVGLFEILIKNYAVAGASDIFLFCMLAVYLFINNKKFLRRGKN